MLHICVASAGFSRSESLERSPGLFGVLDTSVTEGNSGTTDATFAVAVQLDEYGNTTGTVAMDYATSDDTARITTSAKDAAGNALAQPKTWSFTTAKR